MSLAAARQGPSTGTPTDGSRTIIVHDSQPREDSGDGDDASGGGRPSDGVLRLRGGPRSRPRVAWTEDVIDNEGMGKKKSKICCIYHKPKRFDESSSESDSSDSDASDSGSDSGRARPGGRLRHNHRAHGSHPHPHHQGEGSGDGQAMRDSDGSGTVQEIKPDESGPNAYERTPGAGKGKGKREKESDFAQA